MLLDMILIVVLLTLSSLIAVFVKSAALGTLMTLHTLAAFIWVGGMFFALMCLRPAVSIVLDQPASRLQLWLNVFKRFFVWVWAAIITLLGTGLWLIFGFFGGMKGVGVYVHVMLTSGLLMMLIFAYLYFVPYRRLHRYITAQDWPNAAKQQNQIRILVMINLILGLLTSVVAIAGRYGVF